MKSNLIIKFETILRRNRQRLTAPKRQIFDYLLTTNQPVSAVSIAKNNPNINSSTIYRILNRFVTLKIIKIVPQGFKIRYELGDGFNQHHHHLTCENCGRAVAFDSPELEHLIKKISLNLNMKPTKHHIELYGLCSACQSQ
ncbi:MAG: transcriptional repressor [Candidatus Nomurabacteria bacterium]|jgi:Fe2+ or Zn2+ uptake regulation protein|nr:transcriptional repressor [Candidatus Nomurabacteria bacterium]